MGAATLAVPVHGACLLCMAVDVNSVPGDTAGLNRHVKNHCSNNHRNNGINREFDV